MPLIDPTYTANTEIRLLKLEQGMTAVLRLARNCVNKEQFNRLNIVRQQTISTMESRIAVLEIQIAQLETLYNDLL